MKKLMVLLMIVFLGFSCSEKYLDETDPARYTEVNFMEQYNNAPEAMVNSVYVTLNDLVFDGTNTGGPLLYFDEGRGDDVMRQKDYFETCLHSYILFDFTQDDSKAQDAWKYLYQGIFRANYTIKKLTDIDAVKYKRFIGEATFLRGFYYFTLARWYGSVPIIKEYTETIDFYPAQSPATDVWAQAESDMVKALELLIDVVPPVKGKFNGRVDKGVVLSLLARLHFYQARPGDGSNHWQKVIDYCQQVKDMGIYSLEPNFINVFDITRYYANQNNEFIFPVCFAYGVDNAGVSAPGSYYNRLTRIISPYAAGKKYYLWHWVDPTTKAIVLGRECRGSISMSPAVFSLFDQSRLLGDKRYAACVLYPKFVSYRVTGGVLYADSINMVPLGIRPCIYKYRAEGLKFEHNSLNTSHPWSIMRYADVLLMMAEAQNEVAIGPTTAAYDNINQVRSRAGLTNLSGLSYAGFRDAVWNERRLEFLFEGLRVPDLIRTDQYKVGKFTPPDPGSNAFLEKFTVIPIPSRELRVNPNLVQNELWR